MTSMQVMARLLLIEDDEFIRDLYKRQFELAGFQLDAVTTGSEGLQSAKTTHYDLILLDIMLPDQNGLQILKQLKVDPATKTIPVAILSNLGQEQVVQEGYALGANSYFIKANMSPDQIVEQVKSMVSLS